MTISKHFAKEIKKINFVKTKFFFLNLKKLNFYQKIIFSVLTMIQDALTKIIKMYLLLDFLKHFFHREIKLKNQNY